MGYTVETHRAVGGQVVSIYTHAHTYTVQLCKLQVRWCCIKLCACYLSCTHDVFKAIHPCCQGSGGMHNTMIINTMNHIELLIAGFNMGFAHETFTVLQVRGRCLHCCPCKGAWRPNYTVLRILLCHRQFCGWCAENNQTRVKLWMLHKVTCQWVVKYCATWVRPEGTS